MVENSIELGVFRVLQKLFYSKETSFCDMKHGCNYTDWLCLIAQQVYFVFCKEF